MGTIKTDGDDPYGGGSRPYTCMGCDASLEVQYHTCPSCGGYDIRRAKWVAD